MSIQRLSLVAAAIAAFTAVAPSAHARVVSVDAAHFVVEQGATFNAPPNVVFRALTQDVAHWWSSDHTYFGKSANMSIEAYAGGCFCERTDDGRQAEHMRVVFVDPARGIKMVGGLGPLKDMGVSGTLSMMWATTSTGKTKVTWRYRVTGAIEGNAQKMAAAVDGVLSEQLKGLEQVVAKSSAQKLRPVEQRRPPRPPDPRMTAPRPRGRR